MSTMKPLSAVLEAAAKRERQKVWTWSRRHNGFSDLPIFRLVATRLGMPPHQVQAFAHRLEEFANDAGNRGHWRGEVGHFDAEEFATALGMPAEDASRIFAAMEEKRWIVDGHIADFQDRNRDTDYDEGAKNRKRRERARKKVLETLAPLARRGLIEPDARTRIEVRLYDIEDAELYALQAALLQSLSTERKVSRVTDACHRDDHVEQSTTFSEAPVDNSGAASRGAAAGSVDEDGAGISDNPQADAAAWLLSTGVKLVTQRMDEHPGKTATRVQRWLDQQMNGDAVALREIIEGVAAGDTTVARFLVLVTDGIERWKRRPQGTLALLPPRPNSAKKRASEA